MLLRIVRFDFCFYDFRFLLSVMRHRLVGDFLLLVSFFGLVAKDDDLLVLLELAVRLGVQLAQHLALGVDLDLLLVRNHRRGGGILVRQVELGVGVVELTLRFVSSHRVGLVVVDQVLLLRLGAESGLERGVVGDEVMRLFIAGGKVSLVIPDRLLLILVMGDEIVIIRDESRLLLGVV